MTSPCIPRSIACCVLSLAALAAAGLAHADNHAIPALKFGVERCLPTVLAKTPGETLQAVLKAEGKDYVWEFELVTPDGKLHDIECSAMTGKIVETETRVTSADAPGFKEKMKVTEATARATALAKYPGEVERVEFEIEADGKVVYEYDIKTPKGDWRVEVDATSGAIVEASRELLEIGRLPM